MKFVVETRFVLSSVSLVEQARVPSFSSQMSDLEMDGTVQNICCLKGDFGVKVTLFSVSGCNVVLEQNACPVTQDE